MPTIEDIDQARDAEQLNAAFKAVIREAIAEGDNIWKHPVMAEASEAWRKWHVRAIARRDGTRVPGEERRPRSTVPRKALHEQLAHAADDGSITCTGVCGEAKPANKFPTARGGIGRLSECRACRDAGIAERKAASCG